MKRFALLAALTLFSAAVSAQPKSEVTTARDPVQGPVTAEEFAPAQIVSVALGEAKIIKFNRMVGDVQTSVNNVVRTAVMGDKFILSVTGVSPGSTDLVVVNQYSEVIYLARVNVSGGLKADEQPSHIVRTYGWSDAGSKKGGNSIVTVVNGDSKGTNNDPSPDFIERYCSQSGCSQPLNRAAQGAGLDRADPLKER